MDAKDKYLMGMLWKFGTIKPGTNQFVFQSYDKYEQMEYIRKRLAPSKVIKVSTRKDPRTGVEKTLYRLNFTNEEWAENVRVYEGTNVEKIIDKEFLRGFLETKGTVSKNCNNKKSFNVSVRTTEIDIISNQINSICGTNNIKIKVSKTGAVLQYGLNNTIEIISTFSSQNPKHWGEVLKKMNPDD